MDNEWITVANAASILGVSKQAIRQRIYRDTIEHYKAEDGTVYVRITEHNAETNGKTNDDILGSYETVKSELVDELRDRVGFLERQLEAEREANRENRRIIAGLVQRVPEASLEPATEAPRSAREEPLSASEGPGKGGVPPEEEKRSWWRRFFGL